MLKKNLWPMKNKVLKEHIKSVYHQFRNRIALKTVNTFKLPISFCFANNKNIKKTFSDKQLYFFKKQNFYRNYTKWNKILKKVNWMRKHLILKILAIEIIFNKQDSKLPGIDKISFVSTKVPTNEKKRKIFILKQKFFLLRQIKTETKSKINQNIFRGKTKYTSINTKLRVQKNKKTRISNKSIKKNLGILTNMPLQYLQKWSYATDMHNKNIKFNLLDKLKEHKLQKYKNVKTLMNWIQKSNGKQYPTSISNVFDKSIQAHLKLIIKPYLKPLNAQMFISSKHNKIFNIKMKQLYNMINSIQCKINKQFFTINFPEYILKTKITNSFSKLFYRWILYSTPLHHEYRNLVYRQCKTTVFCKIPFHLKKYITLHSDKKLIFLYKNIINKDTSEKNRKKLEYIIKNIKFFCSKANKIQVYKLKAGNYIKIIDNYKNMLQTNTITPTIVAWTTNKLKKTIENQQKLKTCYSQITLFKFTQYFDSTDNITQLKKNLKWTINTNSFKIIYFTNHFFMISNNTGIFTDIKKATHTFLKKKGLKCSKNKEQRFQFNKKTKFNFSIWTMRYIKTKSKKKINWIKINIQTSKKDIKKLKKNIKSITSLKNNHKTIYAIIKKINHEIIKWTKAFLLTSKQSHFEKNLEWYIMKRCKRFLIKKFGTKNYMIKLKNHLQIRKKLTHFYTKQNSFLYQVHNIAGLKFGNSIKFNKNVSYEKKKQNY